MAREGTKRAIAIEYLNKNIETPMETALVELQKLCSLKSRGEALAYYKNLVVNFCTGYPDDVAERWARKPKAPAEKQPKAPKEAKPAKVATPKAPEKTAAELEAIRAANKEKMKAVLAKRKNGAKGSETMTGESTVDLPPAMTVEDAKDLGVIVT